MRKPFRRVLLCGLLLVMVSYAGPQAAFLDTHAADPALSPAGAGVTAPTGTYANGTVLPNGRLVTPAGTLYDLGDFPLGIAVSPDGVLAVAINSGQGYGLNSGFNSYCTPANQGNAPCPYTHPANPKLAATAGNRATHAPDQSLSVVNLRTGQVAEVKAIPTSYDPAKRGTPGSYNFFYSGVVFSPNGKHLYAAGGGNDEVYDFPVAHDVVGPKPIRTVLLPSGVPIFLSAGITKGLAVTPDGRYLLVTHELNNSLDIVDTATYAIQQVSLGTPLLGGDYPYGVSVSPDGRTAYVALQGAGRVAVIGLQAGSDTVRGTIRVGDHPTAIAISPDGSQLYVANAGDDTLSIVTTANSRVAATVRLHALPNEALGATPNAVSVSKDGQRLYVALAGDDAVAVLGTKASLAGPGTGQTLPSPKPADFALGGFIPSGWYPSAVATGTNTAGTGGVVYIVSAKGLGSRPTAIPSSFTYDGNNMPGLLQAVPAPDAAALRAGTRTVQHDIAFASAGDNGEASTCCAHNPIPTTMGGPSPIRHVILIVRENRTFDQVLGDAGVDQGRDRSQLDGEPAYAIFGRETTPNAHALVGDPLPGTSDPAYATADNFYSDGEASIQGHYWTSSANVSDYVEKSWRLYYSPRHRLQDPLSSIAEPHNCSIFQAALRQADTSGSFTFRDYGEVIGLANPSLIQSALSIPGNASPGVPEQCAPIPTADVSFAGGSNFKLDVDNRLTAQAFLSDVGLAADGTPAPSANPTAHQLRSFSYIVMAGDHTGGLAFANTPRSRVAQNDAGLGMIVQALSHSSYWSSTAIFVMEDDSQDGLDHRDGHRNLLYVVSPYARHVGADGKPGYVGHRHYSQASVLKTIDLIFGFPYLSTYDQNASPLYDLFQEKDTPANLTPSDLAPFTVQPAPGFIDEQSAQYKRNHQALAAVPAAESRNLNLSAPDVAGPMLEVIAWQLAHPDQPVPAPLEQEQSRAQSRK